MEVRAGYKQTEVGVIPADWGVAKIASIITDISMGPFGSDIKVSNFISSGVPVLSGANVASERLIESFVNFVSPAKANSLKKAVARRGDIVVTHRGTLGQISYIPNDSVFDRYVISQSQFRAHFSDNLVIPAWVVLYFHSERGSKVLLEGKGHTGVPALAQPTKTFRGLIIPLPPKAEQEAIAEALSDADALIESLEQLIAKKRHIKQGAMQELLTGKKRLPGFGGEWEVKRLGDVATLYQPITISAKQFTESGFPVYGANGVVGFYCDFNHENWQVTITCRGSTCGTVNKTVNKSWITGNAMVVNSDANPNLNKEFLYYLLKYQDLSACITGTGQPQIVRGPLDGFKLTIPPKTDEQTAIAAILSDMDAENAALEDKLTKARQLKQGMMQELLTGRIRLA